MSARILLIVLLSPLLILWWHTGEILLGDWNEIIQVVSQSLLQALLSSLGTLALSLLGALGLIGFQGKRRTLLDILFLLPSFLPSLYVLISVLNLTQLFGFSPSGLGAVAGLHILIHTGFVSVALARILESRFGSYLELASLEGATRSEILRRVLLPLLRADFLRLGFLVLSIAFSSFAIPLILGGQSGRTLDVLIFERLNSPGGFQAALGVAMLQIAFLFVLSFLIPMVQHSRYETRQLRAIAVPAFVWIPALCSLLCAAGWFGGWGVGLQQWLTFDSSRWDDMFYAFSGSWILGMLTGLFTMLGFVLVLWSFPKAWLERFLRGFLAPSLALIGLAWIFLPRGDEFISLMQVALGLAIVSLPALYRWLGAARLEELRPQVEQAQILGASKAQIFRSVLWPQAAPTLWRMAGLASFWAVGDFALTAMLIHREATLGVVVSGLLAFYRLEMAALALWPLFLVGLVCYLFFLGASYVFGSESQS